MGLIDVDLERYAGLGLVGVRAILEDLEDGGLSAAEAEEHLLKLFAEFVDELVPTGPFDLLDDEPIEQAVRAGFELLKDLLHRDVAELRASAEKWRARIAEAEAAGRKRVGFPPVSLEKATAKVQELELRASMLEARDAISEEE